VDQAAALRRDHRGHGGPPAPVGCETAALTKAEGARRGGGRGGGLEGGAGSRAEQACVWAPRLIISPACRAGE
jgi:hypothetical protein